MAAITAFAPDVVFNLCESLSGDARFEPLLPLLLEHAGIAYTGSPPLALGAGAAQAEGEGRAARRGRSHAGRGLPDDAADVSAVTLPFPLIVKPSREDASTGISSQSVVHERAELERQVAAVIARYRQPALVERYIEGREIYVSMLGRRDGGIDLLPLHEIDFSEMPAGRPRIVSFAAKWEETSAEYRGTKPVPCAGLPADVAARIATVARERVRGDGAARLRPPGHSPRGRRHPLRHRREPQLRSVGSGRRICPRRPRRRSRLR